MIPPFFLLFFILHIYYIIFIFYCQEVFLIFSILLGMFIGFLLCGRSTPLASAVFYPFRVLISPKNQINFFIMYLLYHIYFLLSRVFLFFFVFGRSALTNPWKIAFMLAPCITSYMALAFQVSFFISFLYLMYLLYHKVFCLSRTFFIFYFFCF